MVKLIGTALNPQEFFKELPRCNKLYFYNTFCKIIL